MMGTGPSRRCTRWNIVHRPTNRSLHFLTKDGIAAADHEHAFEGDQMTAFGALRQLHGITGTYPYAAWEIAKHRSTGNPLWRSATGRCRSGRRKHLREAG